MRRPRCSVPRAVDEYGRPLSRISTSTTSPLEPDWLVTRRLHRDVRAALSSFGRGLLLDVGCGGRPYESAMPAGVEYLGIDTPASSLSQPDVWSLADPLPFQSNVFHTVLCTQVLEHLAEPKSAIFEFSRVLRPGGHLILTAPQAWNLHEIPYDFFRYTRYGLEHLCRAAGLEPIHISAEGGYFATIGVFTIIHIGSYAQSLARKIVRSSEHAPSGQEQWRRWLWPLRLPMAAFNLLFALLDSIPHPQLFALNNIVVASKPDHETAEEPIVENKPNDA